MVYVDLLVIEDLIYSFEILLSVSILLNRITNLKKIILSSVIGTIPLIFLFININKLLLFIITIIFSIIMSIISFKYKDILYTLKNISYMFLTSIFIAGSIYLINTSFIPNIDSYILNFIILLLILPIIIYIYLKSIINFKINYSNYYKVDIYLKENKKISVTAFLDTGNKLIDPYTHKPVILISKNLIPNQKHTLLIPYNTVNTHDLLKCIVPNKIYIENVGYRNKLLIGLVEEINIDGIDCILNTKLIERI